MPGGDTTVLVVEDERELADLYGKWLTEAGYAVRTAYTGPEAVDAFDGAVDIVLLDRRLPRTSGEEVLERIRETGHDCQVAMVTAVEPEADIVDMRFDEYLVKPVTQDDITDLVGDLASGVPDTVENAVLDALGDPKTRRCLYAIQQSPRSAKEVAEVTGYGLSTVYRRLNSLKQADLIGGRTVVDDDGDHYRVYAVLPERVTVDFADGIRVEAEPTDASDA